MKRHNQMLYRAARSILKNEAEAEDAVQEAYMQAYKAMGDFRGDAKVSTWLVRIVVNESITRLHKQTRRAEVIRLDGEDVQQDQHSSEDSMNESAPEHPERAAQRAEARRLLEAKIDQLPDAFRTVFVLRAVEEMTVEEAAVALGIPEATVRTRFFRARGCCANRCRARSTSRTATPLPSPARAATASSPTSWRGSRSRKPETAAAITRPTYFNWRNTMNPSKTAVALAASLFLVTAYAQNQGRTVRSADRRDRGHGQRRSTSTRASSPSPAPRTRRSRSSPSS